VKNHRKHRAFPALILALAAGLALAGCAAKTVPVWGDPQTGLILRYQMLEGRVLKYASSAETTQTAEVFGQKIDVNIFSDETFSAALREREENKFRLDITIDDMSLEIQSTQGDLKPDMSTVIGKSFEMVLSPLGAELELIGAESIEYDMGPEGTRNIAAGFQDIFPNLPEQPVKINDTWPEESTIHETSSNGEADIRVSGVNKLEGFETINGMECARVSTEFSGTIEGKAEQQGVEILTSGDISGSSTWYFA